MVWLSRTHALVPACTMAESVVSTATMDIGCTLAHVKHVVSTASSMRVTWQKNRSAWKVRIFCVFTDPTGKITEKAVRKSVF